MSVNDQHRRSTLASQIYQELLSDVGMGQMDDETFEGRSDFGGQMSEESTSLVSESVGPRPTPAATSADMRRGSRQSRTKSNNKTQQRTASDPSKANEKCVNTESCVILTRKERENQKKVWERRLKKTVAEMQRRQESKELRSEVNRLSDEVRQLKMQIPSPYYMPPVTSPHPHQHQHHSPQMFIQQRPAGSLNQNFSSPMPTQLVGYAIEDGWSAGNNQRTSDIQHRRGDIYDV